jgi:two-component system, NarL family, response regulator
LSFTVLVDSERSAVLGLLGARRFSRPACLEKSDSGHLQVMPPHDGIGAPRRRSAKSVEAPRPRFAPDSIGVSVVDSDPLAREGIGALIAADANVRLLQETARVRGVLAGAAQASPDVVFVEAGLASEHAGAAIRTLRRSLPHARVIAFGSGNREEEVFHVYDAGASAYVVRTAIRRDLATAIRCARAGLRYVPPEAERCLRQRERRTQLTSRESTVLAMLAQARSNATIAELLGISVGTVKLHVRSILAKLGVEDRAQAALVALERGFVRIH